MLQLHNMYGQKKLADAKVVAAASAATATGAVYPANSPTATKGVTISNHYQQRL